MTYRHIAITAKIAPLATVLTDEYQQHVMAEARLANAAPALLNACRYAEGMLALFADEHATTAEDLKRRVDCMRKSAQRVLRAAIDDATDTQV